MNTLSTRILLPSRLVWPALFASLVLVASGTGIAAPLAPLAVVAALMFVFGARMDVTAIVLLTVSLLFDNPGERPMEGKWNSPFLGMGEVLYLNLHKLTGIEALRISALEVLIAVFMFVVVLRKVGHDPIDDPQGLGVMPNPMKSAFLCFFTAIVLLELRGLLRGGDFKNSLWQVRQLFWLPILGVLFGHALKTTVARLWLLRVVMGVATVRAALGLYYYLVIARATGERPAYVTTHSDSILAVVAILIAASALVSKPSRDHLLMNLVLQPVLLAGLIVNDRRIAFVSLAGGAITLLLLAPVALQRRLRRAVLYSLPLIALYTAAGWSSTSGIFRPVQIVRSVSSQDDDSSKTRDIENFNLIRTLKAHPIMGSGFGHEYNEVVQGNRVDQFFAQYRFIAHNSVLWLLSLSGWLGFAALWIVFPVAVLIALRVFRAATAGVDQVVSFATIATVLAFVVQAWGDMGLQSWMGTVLVAAFTGATGALWTSMERNSQEPS
ncbi:MAG: O-antigen ligase family protein [Gemmatimonadetes bacterium]|nr:O-antigen ligase family protein [Gemmatimonadota bacterium]